MKINSAIAKGYVMNARNRHHKCEEWSEWLGLMPMGEPITASEIAQLVAEKYGECFWRAPHTKRCRLCSTRLKPLAR